ncbi:MAG: hypothetical protein LBL61_04930 [Elusimicrobiota bacterium]|jgi:hypothetical protein|nr:hypothetical protein [Elusimicrobiota bacterium]
MKNFAEKLLFCFILTASAVVCAGAGETALIVKQEGRKVYMDISELKTKPWEGVQFRITEKGADIINPKTGKNLGKEILKRHTGRIDYAEEAFAAGQLDEPQPPAVLGLEAEFILPAEAARSADAFPSEQTDGETRVLPLWKSDPVEGEAVAAAAANITGAGAELALVLGGNTINIYTLADNKLKKILTAPVNPLRKIIALDAADVKGTGRAQIFATVYDASSERFSTLVYEYDDGKLRQSDTIKGMVKGIAPGNGPRVLYAQDITPASGKFTRSAPARLLYDGKKFTRGDKLTAYKFDSVFGFNTADFRHDGRQNVIFTAPNRRLRIQFEKRGRFIESPSDIDFASTPVRVKFKNGVERLPVSLALFKDGDDNTIIAGIENQAKLGILADTFGSYQSARLYFLKWTGGGLARYARADIDGAVYDIVQAPLGGYGGVIIVPSVSTAGYTTISLFKAY